MHFCFLYIQSCVRYQGDNLFIIKWVTIIIRYIDNEGGAILVLLDLSAAFDTIDHQKLLNLLNQSFGIRGVALKWFESYLKDRTQTVQIGSCTSTPVTLKYGVPQGSVLGPILFTMYTTPLGNIIRKHGLNFHLYADDTQLYISFQPGVSVSKETAISCLEACIKDIKIWMTNNLLKLNDDKTELIVITTHSNTSQNQHIGINIGDSLITPSREPPRNLGVLFDSTCSLNDHVSKICKSINYNLYSIGKIRKYLDTPTAEKMINCSITSRLDYCNSLLYGAKGYNISQLQLCQNNAARMLSLRRKFDHITPVLKDLHWLPVEQRIEYKVLLLTYKALHGKAPAYISQLLSLYTPTRPLRSENKNLLRVPRCRLEGFGRRCFAYAAPSLWNPLPTPVKCASSIDTFKSSLKTYLFNVAYPSIHWLLYCMSMLFVTLFKCFLFKSALEHGDFSPFLKLALYKCNIIIIIIIINVIMNAKASSHDLRRIASNQNHINTRNAPGYQQYSIFQHRTKGNRRLVLLKVNPWWQSASYTEDCRPDERLCHNSDVIMSTMTSQVTGVSIVCSTISSGADQRKHQSSASQTFVRVTHRWPVDSPQMVPVMRKMFPLNNVIRETYFE